MAKVFITFNPNIRKIGKVVDMPDDEAQVAVREGRARYVSDPPAQDEVAAAERPSPKPDKA